MLLPPCAEAQRYHSFSNHCVVKTYLSVACLTFICALCTSVDLAGFSLNVLPGIDISVTFLSFLANLGYLGCRLWTRDFAPVSVAVSVMCSCRHYLGTHTPRVQDVGVGNVPVI